MARVKKRADNRYCKTRRVNGHKIYGYGATEKAAIEDLEKKINEYKNGRYKKAKELTLDEYHERWAAGRDGVVKPATIRKQKFQYTTISNTIIDKAKTRFGSLKLTEIEAQNVRDLQRILVSETVERKNEDGKTEHVLKYKVTSVNDTIALLKHILYDAVNVDEIITRNPAAGIKALKNTAENANKTIHRALTIEETKKFFDMAAERKSWYYNLYAFMINSGMRCGEVAALKRSEIRNGKIIISHTYTKDEFGCYYIGDTTKTPSGKRTLELTSNLNAAVENQLKQNSLFFNSKSKVVDPNESVFKSPDGLMIRESSVNRDIEAICKKAGIDRFTSHAFRDTYATRALESGMNIKTLQTVLGHADISVTMNTYAHVMETTRAAEMAAVKTGTENIVDLTTVLLPKNR